MTFANPKIIASPISGQPCKPLIKKYTQNGQVVTEAHYIDPSSGSLIRKVLISIEDVKKD